MINAEQASNRLRKLVGAIKDGSHPNLTVEQIAAQMKPLVSMAINDTITAINILKAIGNLLDVDDKLWTNKTSTAKEYVCTLPYLTYS